ncbi:MAG: transposase [Limnobacter sp.]|nr:transposase [Limnobacter sp.]
MPNYKPAYTPEFRQQMVELVAAGRSPSQLAKEFGCHVTSISSWCRTAGVRYCANQDSETQKPLSNPRGPLSFKEREELIALRKKLKRVEMERDILAKATAWFANNND